MSNLGHNVSLVDFLPWNSPAWDCGVMGHFQVRHVSVSAMTAIDTMWETLTTLLVKFNPYFLHKFQIKIKYVCSCIRLSRWLISTLAVRFFHTALNADLKIKSVGLFSVQGVSIQFQPQHTLVRHTFVYMTFML